ncbi:MAG: tetratricopeptide repeat protein [Thermogutta sp.]
MIRIAMNRRIVARAALSVGLMAGWLAFCWWVGPWWQTQRHRERGRELLRLHRSAAALGELRKALRYNPHDAESVFLLSRAYRHQGDLEHADWLLTQAERLGLDPRRTRRERWLLQAQSGDLQAAEPHLAELLIDQEGDALETCQAYVLGYFANLRFDDARRLLDTWRQDHPQDAQVHYLQGYLSQAIAHFPEAVEAYQKAIAIQPDRDELRCRLAEVLMELGKYDEAAEVLEIARRSGEAEHEVALLWAECAYRQGRVAEARRELESLLSRGGDGFAVRSLLGEICLAEGDFSEALPHLQRAAAERPFDVTVRNALAQALRGLGRGDEARPHAEYVAQAEPALRRLEQRIRAAVEQPGDSKIRCEIAAILMQYGDPNDASRWLRSALQLNPQEPTAHALLAAYYRAAGDLLQSRRHEREAMSAIRAKSSRSAAKSEPSAPPIDDARQEAGTP